MFQSLDLKPWKSISRKAALAAVLDMRPAIYEEEHDGIAVLAEPVFIVPKTGSFRVSINLKCYLPTLTAVYNATRGNGRE